MKKYFLLFAAGGLLTLASCGGDTTPAETVNVDSIAAVKADSIANELKAQSDSTIAMAAQNAADSMARVMREDSIVAATKAADHKSTGKTTANKPKPVTTHTATTTKPIPVAEPTPTIGNGKPQLGDQKQNSNTIGNGKPKLGNNK